MSPTISIIICTRNRSASLQETFNALNRVHIPANWRSELLLIDNGSTDDTPAVSKAATLKSIEVKYFSLPTGGKCRALNLGLAHARGDVLVFTDDDVEPSINWLSSLVAPILASECDATVGRITLGPELCRPWMEPDHMRRLAATQWSEIEAPELIGANMAFHRRVLDRVPAFDPELGPGALGFVDDTLFSLQVMHAGFKVAAVPAAAVVHHPDPSRLRRAEWLKGAVKKGQSDAYLYHHWQHGNVSFPRLRSFVAGARLQTFRKIKPLPRLQEEGCPLWEIGYVSYRAFLQQLCKERTRPRNYSKHGLKRLDYMFDRSVERAMPGTAVAASLSI
jgi:glycosyltransferase involved in cell wall biosynthesis